MQSKLRESGFPFEVGNKNYQIRNQNYYVVFWNLWKYTFLTQSLSVCQKRLSRQQKLHPIIDLINHCCDDSKLSRVTPPILYLARDWVLQHQLRDKNVITIGIMTHFKIATISASLVVSGNDAAVFLLSLPTHVYFAPHFIGFSLSRAARWWSLPASTGQAQATSTALYCAFLQCGES